MLQCWFSEHRKPDLTPIRDACAQHCPAPILGANTWAQELQQRLCCCGDSSKDFQVAGSLCCSCHSQEYQSYSANTGLVCLFSFPGEVYVQHSIAGLGLYFGFFFVCLPLVCDGCVTFCFTENGESERFLLEMTLLIFLGSCSLGL